MRTIYFSFYHVLIFIGIFQGILLSYIFLANKQFRRKSSIALAVGLLALSLAGISEILQDLKLDQEYPFLPNISLSNLSVVAIGYYYFVIYLIRPEYKWNRKDYWFVIPFLIIFLSKLMVDAFQVVHPKLTEDYRFYFTPYFFITNYLPIGYLLIVSILVYQELKQYHFNLLDNFAEIQGKNLYWLQNFNYVIFLYVFYWLFVITQLFITQKKTIFFYGTWIFACLMICWIAYIVILKRDVFAIPVFKKSTEKEDKNSLSDKTEEHYEKLLELLKIDKLYRDMDLNMNILSEKMGLSNGYLSKIINQKEGKNFYEFINTYRIEEVKAHLSNPDYSHYSILGIGLEAGFKSKSTFNAVFKKMTGMTPSAYKKQL